MEDNFHDVIVAMPVLRQNPFTAHERGKLTRHPLTVLLMTDRAVLNEDTLADDHRIGRGARAASSSTIPGDARRVEDLRTKPAAVPKKVTGPQKSQRQKSDDQPGGEHLCSLTRGSAFAQQLFVLLDEVPLLVRFLNGRFLDHGVTEGVRLPAEGSPASGKGGRLQALWLVR